MSEIDLEQRRWIGRGIRFGLVALTVILMISWFSRKRSAIPGRITIPPSEMTEAPAVLAPGDMRIISQNGAVELVLKGNEVLAGLSPAKVAEVKAEMERSSAKDTSGLGGLIASSVKRGVSGLIGAHAAYPVRDITDISYENGRLVLRTKSNGRVQLFDKNNGGRSDLFAPEDAQRFVDAVRARMREQR